MDATELEVDSTSLIVISSMFFFFLEKGGMI
jgi:hypothetical protein